MTDKKIGLLEVRDLVRDVVIDNPDRVASAYYIVNDQPHCIVGVLLADMGWPLHDLAERGTACQNARTVVRYAPAHIRVRFTAEACLFLNSVQDFQDAGLTWWNAYMMTCADMAYQIERALNDRVVSSNAGLHNEAVQGGVS